MATLLYGVVDPDEGRLRLATAGHPPVLVIGPAGDAYFAEGPAGSPLGVVPFPSYEESTIPLVPGSTVLLYTDGLVERPEAPLDEGLEWLRGFAAGVPAHPDELCGALLQARFRDAPPRDDVALLAVRLEPVPLERMELTLRAEPESLAQMRRALGRWLRAVGRQRRRDLRDAGRLRRGLRQRDRPRLPARARPPTWSRPAGSRRRGRAPGPRLRQLAAAALGLAGPRARTDRGADGRGRDRPRPGRHDRPHAPRARRRGRGRLMRDRIAGFEFEQRDDVLIAVGRGRDRQLERGRAAPGAVRAPAERLERPGPRPQRRDLPRQLRDPPAVRPRPPARRPPPGAAPGRPGRRRRCAGCSSSARSTRSRRWTASSTPRCGRSPRPRSESSSLGARTPRLRRPAGSPTTRPGSAASRGRAGGRRRRRRAGPRRRGWRTPAAAAARCGRSAG